MQGKNKTDFTDLTSDKEVKANKKWNEDILQGTHHNESTAVTNFYAVNNEGRLLEMQGV